MFLHELSDQQREAFMCLAHDIVVSDGELSPGETLLMEKLRRETGVDESFNPSYLAIDGIEKIFDTRRARVAIVIALIRLAYADGAFEIEEQFLLKDICKAFSISEPDFGQIENWVRRLIALEKEAHTFL